MKIMNECSVRYFNRIILYLMFVHQYLFKFKEINRKLLLTRQSITVQEIIIKRNTVQESIITVKKYLKETLYI